MNKINALQRRGLKKFWASKSGGVLIYIAFGLPILLGVMALSVDLGRAFILNTELKDFSDAAALAGAAELDGRAGARVAAESAARTGLQGTLVNVQSFATDGSGADLVVDQVVFLKNLPADGTDFVAGDTATTDAEARFIFVSVVNRDVRSGLSRALGVIPDFDTGAKSIAGFNAVHCRIPALMMCNPLEDADFPITDSSGGPISGCTLADKPDILAPEAGLYTECLSGRQMLAKKGGGGGAYVPGNFGLLDCPSGDNGTNCIAPYLAAVDPGFCVLADGTVNFRTGGATGPIRTAMNTRFDMFENPFFGGEEGNSAYRPAINVTKGQPHADVCDSYTQPPLPAAPTAADLMGFPQDKCFRDGSLCGGAERWGNWGWMEDLAGAGGNTDLGLQYWLTNHPANPDLGLPGAYNTSSTLTGASKPYEDMTRYELYRWEIESGNIPNNPLPNGEKGHVENIPLDPTRQCYTGGGLSDPSMFDPTDPDQSLQDAAFADRRVISLAVVNCLSPGVAPLNGNESNVPIIGFIDLFLTEPSVDKGSEKANIWAEIIRVAPIGVNGLRDIVQLYR
ncbi:MAG: hypothetical protein HKN28_11795 [Alphaproteobacteria bacterium]|nr:hypothetical protein [Alphaproteobacteria bacterium]